MKHRNRLLRVLTIIGALCTCAAKAEETSKESKDLNSAVRILANSEQKGVENNHVEIGILPEVTWEQGEDKLEYKGCFYRSKDTNGTATEWTTVTSGIKTENESWILDMGRTSTRAFYTPTTINFDNKTSSMGANRIYTGLIFTHKETGISLGQVAEDTRMTPSHWDSTLIGWNEELDNEWAVQLQATTGPRLLTSAAATVRWQPTETTVTMAEVLYKDHKETGVLTVNHKMRDDLTLFAGARITNPQRGKPEGVATAGVIYNLRNGFQLIGAIEGKDRTEKEISAILGIKYTGNLR